MVRDESERSSREWGRRRKLSWEDRGGVNVVTSSHMISHHITWYQVKSSQVTPFTWCIISFSSKCFESPKSINLSGECMPGCSNKKFSSLRSLWAMPCSCRYRTADRISHINFAAWDWRERREQVDNLVREEEGEGVEKGEVGSTIRGRTFASRENSRAEQRMRMKRERKRWGRDEN